LKRCICRITEEDELLEVDEEELRTVQAWVELMADLEELETCEITQQGKKDKKHEKKLRQKSARKLSSR